MQSTSVFYTVVFVLFKQKTAYEMRISDGVQTCALPICYHTGVEAQKLMSTDDVLAKARQAKEAGASRFCMGAAWRSPKDRDIPEVAEMIREVKALGLETCATLGMLSGEQAGALKAAGLDRSEEHTSELQSLMRTSYAVICLKKKKHENTQPTEI